MKRWSFYMIGLLLASMVFSSCGKGVLPVPSPEQSTNGAVENSISQSESEAPLVVQWVVEPNFKCDEIIPIDQPDFLTTTYSLYKRGDQYGVVDQSGNIVYSEQKKMNWCFACGLVDGEGNQYTANGAIQPYMHAHGVGSVIVYDTITQKALEAGEYGMYFSVRSYAGSKVLAPIVKIEGAYSVDTAENCDAQITPQGEKENIFCLVDSTTGKRVTDETYLAARGSWEINDFTEKEKNVIQGYTACTNQDEWFFYTKDGQKLPIEPYEDAKPFHSGFAAVKRNGNWGYIDEQGEPLTPFEFEDAASGYAGKAWAKQNGLWGVVQVKDGVQKETASDQTVIVTADGGLRMRKIPNIEGEILEVIAKGTALQVVGESEGWYRVEYNAQMGWVSAQHTIPG